jgi:hypothetical protein
MITHVILGITFEFLFLKDECVHNIRSKDVMKNRVCESNVAQTL